MHDTATNTSREEALFALATEQAGYFTSAQAHALGYSWPLIVHHTRSGRFIHLRRGLYRLRDYPSSRREEVVAAWLAVGKDVAVVSHESALEIHELSDVVPDATHLLVPRSRRYLHAQSGIILHTTTRPLSSVDVVTREGMRVTAPLRSILDAAETGTAGEQIVMAVQQALQRGWVTEPELRVAAQTRGGRVEALVTRGLLGE
jgi:predicted transcriptional regulator of viral defense system